MLAGGEAAALVMVEAVARLLPGVLGNAESLVEESRTSDGLLEYPVYTKPAAWRGREVPDGAAVRRPRAGSTAGGASRRCVRTALRRPDLIAVAASRGDSGGRPQAGRRRPGRLLGRR